MQQPILFPLQQRALAGFSNPVGPLRPALHPQGFLDRILIPRWYIDPGGAVGGLNNGSSWANAFNSSTTAWADAIAASAAGDDFYVNAASNCSNGSAQTLTFKGTAANPNRIFSCTGITNNPPQQADLGTGAQFTTTGNSQLTIRGYVYVYGVIFNAGSGANAAGLSLADFTAAQVYDSCTMKCLSTGSSSGIGFSGNNQGSKLTFINTPIFLNGGTGSFMSMSDGIFIWKNTPNAIAGTQAALASLFLLQGGNSGIIICDGVDFIGTTGIATGKNLCTAAASSWVLQFINCKVNAGVLIPRPTAPQAVIDQIVTDSTTTTYKQQRDTLAGTSTADTVRYNNATDGVTAYSLQVITTANAKPHNPFECIAIPQWVAAGTYAASKVFITSAVPLLKTNDVWVEAEFLGASYPLASPATSFGDGSGSATLSQIPQGTVPATIPSASPAWATGSLGYDYQLTIPSFTTSVAGYVRFVVKVGKASLTVNIDPAVTVA